MARFLFWAGLFLIVQGPLWVVSSAFQVPAVSVVSDPVWPVATTEMPPMPPSAKQPDRPLMFEPLAPATPIEDVGAPLRVRLDRIGINARVVPATVSGDRYQVPSFAVGHHADSPLPGEPGNAVLNGHVESINAGQVFATLPRAEVGDLILVTSERMTTTWEVTSVRTFASDDTAWLISGADPLLTLYTCTGTFDWRKLEYADRLVVTARRTSIELRAAG